MPTPQFQIAIGILINPENKILIAKRPENKYYGGYWEFPGGKVEENESVFTALQREFREEIGIEIISADPWLKYPYSYPERNVLLDVWQIKNFSGIPHGAENQEIRWITPKEFSQYKFPEGNGKIMDKLIRS